jgi:hypothetical protein
LERREQVGKEGLLEEEEKNKHSITPIGNP